MNLNIDNIIDNLDTNDCEQLLYKLEQTQPNYDEMLKQRLKEKIQWEANEKFVPNGLMVKYMMYLKQIKFEPKVIYDIGAHVGSWSKLVKLLFPQAQIIHFDAYELFEDLYKNDKYFIGCLSDQDDKEVDFYDSSKYDDSRIKSYFKNVDSLDSSIKMKTHKLDSVVEKMGFPLPDLVKISCGGAEKDIIAGGVNTLSNAKHMIINLQNTELYKDAPLANVTGPFIQEMGFQFKGVLDCYQTPLLDYHFENNK